MSQNKEIEIHVEIENSKNLEEFLNKKAKFVGEKHQIDKYYTPQHRNFINPRPISEWLRLRDSSGKISINYKKWYFDEDGRSQYCDEYETGVENLESMEKILKSIDIKDVCTVDKIRKIWIYENYEVAIDFIHGLGEFVEIEYKGDSDNKTPKEITDGMVEFLKRIDCGKIKRNYQGYPFQIMFSEEVVFEEV